LHTILSIIIKEFYNKGQIFYQTIALIKRDGRSIFKEFYINIDIN
jgi:hypothetical protein